MTERAVIEQAIAAYLKFGPELVAAGDALMACDAMDADLQEKVNAYQAIVDKLNAYQLDANPG